METLTEILTSLKHFALIFFCLFAGCTQGEPFDQLELGEHGRVVRILDGDALVLDTGQSVRLVSIEAPAFGSAGAEDVTYAKESARMLEDMAMGRRVQLFYPGLTRDRYDRALAHVRTDDTLGPELWLNLEMIRQGGARVRLYPDTAILGEILYEAERSARIEKTGLWRKRAYNLRSASQMTGEDGGFQLVKGSLGNKVPILFERVMCARELDHGAIILDIMPAAAALCDMPVGDVTARGYLREGRMQLVHPLNLERMDQHE